MRARVERVGAEPSPSWPTTTTTWRVGDRRHDRAQRRRARSTASCASTTQPSRASSREHVRPRLGRRERHRQRRAHRRADRFPIERVGATRLEQHGIDAEGGGASEHRPDVVGVADALERDELCARAG